jgi:hypothetical protein
MIGLAARGKRHFTLFYGFFTGWPQVRTTGEKIFQKKWDCIKAGKKIADLFNQIFGGFPPQKTTRTPVGILPAPQGLILKQGPLSGLLIAKANPVFGASIYNWTCMANTPGAVPLTAQGTAANWAFGGLTPGVIYTVTLNAVGAAGPSNWSNPASLMVI